MEKEKAMEKAGGQWKNIKELIEYPKEGILSKELFAGENFEATLFCLAKGARISEHTSTRQGIIFVIDGEGMFNLGGEDIAMLPNVLITMKSSAVHSLRAQENMSFVLLLIQ